MKLLNISGPQDFLALVVRRKWWILIPFLALSCATILVTYMLPKVYVSQALILIQPRDVPSDLVRNLIAGTTAERLSAIQQTVLSRMNLVQIVREFEDQLPEYKNLNMDDKVLKLGNQIRFNFSADDKPGSGQLPVTTFRISYQSANPELAQKIAKRVTELFIARDNDTRERQVGGTTEFFSAEVDKLADQLKVSDSKLKELKGRRRYELPAQLDSNLRSLDIAGGRRQSLSSDLLVQKQNLSQWEQRFAETPETVPKPAAASAPPAAPDPKIAEYRAAIAEKKALTAKGDLEGHPEVLLVNKHLDRLKNEMSPEDMALAEKPDVPQASALAETMPNPAYKALVNTIDNIKLGIKLTEDQIAKADQDIDVFNKRIANEPQGELELADIARENSDLNKQYEDMKAKLSESKLSESLESKQKGAQFQIIDQPNLPLSPTKPQKYVVAAIGILISLMLGIGFGIAADVANQKMWTMSDVETLLGTTVLVEIPEIVTASDLETAQRKRIKQIASLLAATAVYGVSLYFFYLHQSFVLRHLEPILQRLY